VSDRSTGSTFVSQRPNRIECLETADEEYPGGLLPAGAGANTRRRSPSFGSIKSMKNAAVRLPQLAASIRAPVESLAPSVSLWPRPIPPKVLLRAFPAINPQPWPRPLAGLSLGHPNWATVLPQNSSAVGEGPTVHCHHLTPFNSALPAQAGLFLHVGTTYKSLNLCVLSSARIERRTFRRYWFQWFPTCLLDMPRLLDWVELLSPNAVFV
jgi:hypothetical protein